MRFFRIAEIADFLTIPVHTIRYWEEQIPQLMSRHRVQNHRVYSLENLRQFFRVRHLIIDQNYTVQKAREKLLEESAEDIGNIKSQCEEIKDHLLSASLAQKKQQISLEQLEKTIKDLRKFHSDRPIH